MGHCQSQPARDQPLLESNELTIRESQGRCLDVCLQTWGNCPMISHFRFRGIFKSHCLCLTNEETKAQGLLETCLWFGHELMSLPSSVTRQSHLLWSWPLSGETTWLRLVAGCCAEDLRAAHLSRVTSQVPAWVPDMAQNGQREVLDSRSTPVYPALAV